MKRFFRLSLLIAIAGTAMVSCNNGDYDANPKVNNSKTFNPFNSANAPGNALGSFTAKFNGEQKSFFNGYMMDTMGITMIAGATTSMPLEVIGITFLETYSGVKTYTVSDTAADISFSYTKADASGSIVYMADPLGGHMVLNITHDANKEVKGTFEGVLYRATGGGPDANDSLVLTEGKFRIKRP